MRAAKVLYKESQAGVLTQHDDGSFTFRYHAAWIEDKSKPGVSLTMPKNEQEFHSAFLFPFFFNMLPEGTNKQVVCQQNRVDPDDYFGILMATAKYDPVGAVRIVKIENQ